MEKCGLVDDMCHLEADGEAVLEGGANVDFIVIHLLFFIKNKNNIKQQFSLYIGDSSVQE